MLLTTTALDGFLEGTVRSATPLAFAALGECVSERSGVINIGLEGAILAGALGGTIAAGIAGPAMGFLAGTAAGLCIAALFAVFAVWMRADQIITGTAITMFALGLTGTLYRGVYGAGGVALSTPTISAFAIPGLSSIPLVGRPHHRAVCAADCDIRTVSARTRNRVVDGAHARRARHARHR